MTVFERAASAEAVDDIVLPFAVEFALSTAAGSCGSGRRSTRCSSATPIRMPVSRLLGEAVALAALLGSTLKLDGRFQLQTQERRAGQYAARRLRRAIEPARARALRRGADRARAIPGESLLGKGHMAFTIDPGGDMTRYQGVIPLEGPEPRSGRARLFRALGADPDARTPRGRRDGRARGARLAGGRAHRPAPAARRRSDAPTSIPATRPKAPSRIASRKTTPGPRRAPAPATTEAHELIDPTLSGERLLFRLFNERGVQVFEPTKLAAVCRCSAEGIDAMLRSFSADDVRDMVGDDGMIGVTCEFCSTKRVFDPERLRGREALWARNRAGRFRQSPLSAGSLHEAFRARLAEAAVAESDARRRAHVRAPRAGELGAAEAARSRPCAMRRSGGESGCGRFSSIETARVLGREDEGPVRAGAAIECMHAYSLVHDDLPSMDDDDLRRGRPTVHRAFDEATAILAGDGLQALAFEILADPATDRTPRPARALRRPRARAPGSPAWSAGRCWIVEAETSPPRRSGRMRSSGFRR